MRRYRTLIKGSASELIWLNRLAQKGWVITKVHGNWYDFKRTNAHYRIFSEYVPNEIATDMATAHDQIFQVLASVPLAVAPVQVVYSGSTRDEVAQTRVEQHNAPLELKIALAMRSHQLNVMNTFFFVGLAFIIIALLITHGAIPNEIQSWIGTIWLTITAVLALRSSHSHRIARQLRQETQNYDGAWRPTMHVFLKPFLSDLDTDKLASLGHWHLVGHGKNVYWYDLETLASDEEVRQSVKKIVPADVTVTVMTSLGLAPIGYF
ncbi:hypothetical protein ACFP1L_00135 [Lactiplantibacillus nangangensis]|uniref:DUF2812 domain-containing protein n=1 Tax=Lactiplantibacillus nangangensis TaxID=2559917 RepID=A0ABW1SFG7_9LACO|nr:hypothetical protein [Lactiplantibacillus nangangensis]